MKKTFLGVALFLLISAANASAAFAAGQVPQLGQPRTEHNILSSQLPASLLADIRKDYKDYWITELTEEGKGKHSDYSIVLENADQIVQLHSSNSEAWVVTGTSVKE
jgi:hypothetical protein